MSETGIGARVRRKEDQRFITGKGRYTDDINVAGQVCVQLEIARLRHVSPSNLDDVNPR